MHLTTQCLLHSHHFPAPLSRNNQEVSCFGDENKKAGDSGDNWKVVCNDDVWSYEDTEVKLKHMDTGNFLATSGKMQSFLALKFLEFLKIKSNY